MEFHRLGQHLQAQEAYMQALRLHPAHPEAFRLLGLLALDTGDGATALRLVEASVRAVPRAGAWCDLGRVYMSLGRPLDAAAAYLEAVRREPDMHDARIDAGVALRMGGRRVEAAQVLAEAANHLPRSLPAALNGALAMIDIKQWAVAAHLVSRAEALAAADPATPRDVRGQILAARAMCLTREQALEAAGVVLEEALALDPKGVVPLGNLARLRLSQGRAAEAATLYDQALAREPGHHKLLSNRLLSAQYVPGVSARSLDRLHRTLAPRLEPWPPPPPPVFTPSRDPDRRLRVGYVSPDLGNHPVGMFMGAVLPFHDPAAVEVVCYSDRDAEDETTAFLRAQRLTWVRTRAMDDEALRRRILDDGIDILVDLAGFTADNRLPVFARRAAPIQLTWAGYVGTTGLAQMDGLIADRFHIPPGEEGHYRETVYRLPGGYIAWRPPHYEDALPVAPPPLLTRGYPTFGCLNTLNKLGPQTVALWARVLTAAPQARLYLKAPPLGDAETARALRATFAAAGVAPERILTEGNTPRRAHLEAYAQVDVALDPLPYVGGVTTLEALWMGVPTITLPGDSFAGRHSLSHLTQAGAAPWCVARDAEDFVTKALALVADPRALAVLRSGWRDRLAASPVCDGAGFTRHLEALFRQVWRQWVMAA